MSNKTPFPPKPNLELGFNQKLVPIMTEAFRGWVLMPIELSADQWERWENSQAAVLLAKPVEWVRPEGDTRPELLILYEGIHHFIYHMEFPNITSAQAGDRSGRTMPSVQIMRAIFYEALKLISRARKLGNLLRPSSGTTSQRPASN